MASFNLSCIPTLSTIQRCENPEDLGFDPNSYPLGTIRVFAGIGIPDSLWKVGQLGDDSTVAWMQVR